MLKIMKNYILFCSDTYYPSGGAIDIVGVFETIQEAIEKALEWARGGDEEGCEFTSISWGHIYSIAENKIVWHRGRHYGDIPQNAENQ